MRRSVCDRPAARGLTLIELVTTMTLISVLAIVGGRFIVATVKTWNEFSFLADTGMQARLGMDWLVREIRETANDTSGASVVYTASATTYDFSHMLVGGTTQNVTFSWDGTAGSPLLRATTAGTSTLIPSVNALALAYYDKNDAALTAPLSVTNLLNVRRVVITMTIKNTVTNSTMKIKGEAILRSPYN